MKSNFKVKFQDSEFDAEYVTDLTRSIDILTDEINIGQFVTGIDTETTPLEKYKDYPKAGLSPHLAELSLVQLFNGTKAYVFDMKKLGAKFKPVLINYLENNKFVAHYAQFDLQFFMKLGVKWMDIGCTRILTRLIYHAVYADDEGLSASLESIVETLFKEKILKKLQISDWGAELTFEQIEYAALDAVCTYKVAEKLAPSIQKFGLERIYKLTKEAQFPIASMQINGFKINEPRHAILLQKWREDLIEARKELVEVTGMQKFTGHAMAEWLEKNLDPDTLSIWPRTDTGKLQTDSHVFADFSYLKVVKPFSKFQKATKLTSTYGRPLTYLINPETKRLHSTFNLCGARTGRLSCSQPNIQQAPRDKEFRSCFIPEKDHVMIRADFNQIEIRVAAELSRDKAMLHAFNSGIDIHDLMASKISGKKIEDVTKDDRQLAKACFSHDTEILTENGWQKFSDLNSCKVFQAAFVQNKWRLSLTEASKQCVLSKEAYKCQSTYIDLLLTPDHLINYIDSHRQLRKRAVKDVAWSNASYMFSSGYTITKKKSAKTKLITRLVAMCVADGCFTAPCVTCRLAFKKKRKYLRAKALLNKLKINYKFRRYRAYYIFDLKDPTWGDVLSKYTTVKKDLKEICLKELCCKTYLEEAAFWDAHIDKYTARRLIRFSTTRIKTANIMQAMAAQVGIDSLLRLEKHPKWSDVYQLSYRLLSTGKRSVKKIKVTKVSYKIPKLFYCVQVPLGNIVIRRNGKVSIQGNCNFGFQYGLGARKFGHYVRKQYNKDISEDEAVDAVQSYRELYSGYRAYQIKVSTEAAKTMSVRTPSGKLRKLNTDNCYGGSLSTAIQGGAAECMLYSLIFLYHTILQVPEYGVKIVNCVHDEIILECFKAYAEEVKHIVKECMINGFTQLFPKGIIKNIVAPNHGISWADSK